jgi:GPH family glycoside/pentoside/hexuronide:cation symporter
MLPQFLLAPLWMRLAQRLGKKRLWLLGLSTSTLGFAGLFFVYEGGWFLALVLVMIIGAGLGVGTVISPSIQADVVDYDGMQTGERKEGTYSAAFNFIRKAGMAAAAGAGGYALSLAGYDGAAEVQSEAVRRAIRLTSGALPVALYLCAILLLRRFRLDEAAHAEVRQRIDRAAR